jgi:hypothetical protein
MAYGPRFEEFGTQARDARERVRQLLGSEGSGPAGHVLEYPYGYVLRVGTMTCTMYFLTSTANLLTPPLLTTNVGHLRGNTLMRRFWQSKYQDLFTESMCRFFLHVTLVNISGNA